MSSSSSLASSSGLRRLRGPLTTVFALSPSLAFAHPGHGEAAGFVHGFLHPISGADHLLAMVAVGLFAYNLGGRALLAVPAAFLALMAAGGALGMAGIALPYAEIGIAASVIVLGAALTVPSRRWPIGAAMGLVGLFALFHGFAHGAEMPENTSGLAFAGGFLLATALLHAVGLGAGFAIGRFGENRIPALGRVVGAFVAVAGVGLLAGVL